MKAKQNNKKKNKTQTKIKKTENIKKYKINTM